MSAYYTRGEAIAHGVWRRVFDDCVTFQPDYLHDNDDVRYWLYAVLKYPFVPGFHVVQFTDEGDPEDNETVLSTHKTLHEAMSVVRVLLSNGGVRYV
jgi:hypothetical protein